MTLELIMGNKAVAYDEQIPHFPLFPTPVKIRLFLYP